jgi:predicted transcriptional regulator of viral defense system
MRDIYATRSVVSAASEQKGLVRAAQLHAAGLSRAAVHRLVVAGWLHPLHNGVYAVGHTALPVDARLLAATYALWPRGVLGHRSAALLQGIAPAGGPIHVIVPTYNGNPHRGPIRVHRQSLRDDEAETWRGIRCTTVSRTILDLAASAPRLLEGCFEEAQVRHGLAPDELAVALVLRRGFRGTARVRRLLDGAVDPGKVQSRLELRFLKLCKTYGLPRPLTQVRLGRWPVDFYFPDARVAVETDGARFHASAAKRRRDARKGRDIEFGGDLLLRLVWAEVVENAPAAAARVRAALHARRLS